MLFDMIDTSDDRRVDRDEFEHALPLFEQWGVHVDDPDAEFQRIDVDGGGRILFDEFSAWALQRGLDNDVNDNVAGEETLLEHHKSAQEVAARSTRKAKRKGGSPRSTFELNCELTMSELIEKLPCGKSEDDAIARKALIDTFDSGDGLISLNDLDRGLRTLLVKMRGGDDAARAYGLNHPPVPAVQHAFEAVAQRHGGQPGRVGRQDFRLLLTYLKWYTTTPTPLSPRLPSKPPSKLPPMGRFPLDASFQSTAGSPLASSRTLLRAPDYLLSAPNRFAPGMLREMPMAEELTVAMRQRADAFGAPLRKIGYSSPRYATY